MMVVYFKTNTFFVKCTAPRMTTVNSWNMLDEPSYIFQLVQFVGSKYKYYMEMYNITCSNKYTARYHQP